MDAKLVNKLCCPLCRGELELTKFDSNGRSSAGSATSGPVDDVATGLLKCSCGISFPIIDGVPRLLETGLPAYPEFVRTYKDKLKGEKSLEGPASETSDRKKTDEYEKIRVAYSKTWQQFDYSNDKTWGWTLDDRKRIFLEDVGLGREDLKGKLVLDAGCGNGTLTAAISTFELDAVGMDLNDGLGSANLNKQRFAGASSDHVQYVQGNLFRPPLKSELFDLIYCSGAVHRTPDSKATFKKLIPLVKKGGRLYVWVSGRRSILVRSFKYSVNKLKRMMSLDGLLTLCRIMAPVFKVVAAVSNFLSIAEFRKRSVREITLDLYDSFAPEYANWHTEDEVQGWFREQGFRNITVSGKQKHGFGVYGDKP